MDESVGNITRVHIMTLMFLRISMSLRPESHEVCQWQDLRNTQSDFRPILPGFQNFGNLQRIPFLHKVKQCIFSEN